MRTRLWRTIGVSLLVTVAFAGNPAQAAPPPRAPLPLSGTTHKAAVQRHDVTLLTGEHVTVTRGPDGKDQAAVAAPGDHDFSVVRLGKDTYVLPAEALPLIGAGRLDRELFNVTRLIDDGYDDAHSATLPVIATYRTGSVHADKAPAGAKSQRKLRSINGVALATDKKQPGRYWRSIEPATPTARTLNGGIDRLWLDGKVKADLAESVPLIGAPEAWRAGHDGTGVKVAVLDTGIDADHPDFAGRLDNVVSFVPGEGARDKHGHGTHVASTIAGTGAASGGKYKGVAPGANLEIGKVLDNSGTGQDSWIIAGMEWAAQHAPVVSMSLGGGPSDGTDPLSLAVNRLTADTGTLFVIAAGNSGPSEETVGSPGAAAAALTVGATSKQDALANFSSRGPLPESLAVKPDLTAPGVNITAARADGTALGSIVDAKYTTLSGTSMATPHVAGAAALLAQQHPGWKAAKLKAALVSTTRQLDPKQVPTEVGTGRIDVARAHDQGVYAEPGNLDVGRLAYPHDGDPVTKQVTYTNDTDTAVTLALTAPAEFHLGASTVTVPAKGSATVDVTVEPKALSDGLHTGYLTATDGTVTTRTTLGVNAESPHYDLNLHVKGRDGAPPSYGFVILVDGQSGEGYLDILTSGDHTLRVPPGHYDAFAAVYSTRDTPTGVEPVDSVLMADHDVAVAADTDLRFDARAAKEVRLHTPQPVDRTWLMVSYQRFFKVGDQEGSPGAVDFFAGGNERLWLAEAAPPATGRLQLNARWYTYEPLIRAQAAGLPLTLSPQPVIDSRVVSPTAAHASPRFDGTRTARVVDVGTADPTALAEHNLAGAVALIRTTTGVPYEDQINAVAKAGAGYAVLWRDLSGGFRPAVGEDLPIPSFALPHEEATALRAAATQRTVPMKLEGREYPSYGYDIMEPLTRMPDGLDVTVRKQELASIDTTVNALAPGHTVGDMRMGLITGVGYVPAFSGVTLGWPAGVHRIDYVRAAPGFQYLERSTPVFEPNPTGPTWDLAHEQYGRPLALRPGQRITERWNTPVWRPGIPAGSPGITTGFPGVTRTGDTIDLSIAGWNDGGSGHAGVYADAYGGAQAKVYRNGELFAQGGALAGKLTVGPERATYRFTHDAQRAAGATPYSAQTHTAWTFTSSHVNGDRAAALPLLQLDYQVDTDTYGRAEKKQHVLELTVRQQDGVTIPVASADLSVSYDDGAHWTKVQLEQIAAGKYQVRLRPPTEATYVSLRVNGADRAGDTVEQTILRAYGLK